MDMKNRTLIFDLGGVLLDIFIDRSFGALMALGMDASILTDKVIKKNLFKSVYSKKKQ